MLKSLFIFVTLILVARAAYTTYYASEQCGNDIQLDKPILFTSSRDGTLPAGFNCTVYFKGVLPVIGGFPLVMARFLKVGMPPANGVNCTDGRIDLIDGLRNPRTITAAKGICGSLPPPQYDYTTSNDSFMAVKISTNGPQAANFKILMQSFQKVENGQTCFAGEFECNNNRCIRELNKCDGYDNCGDLSDETYDRCKPTVYLDEVCGMSITIYDMIKLKSSRSTSLISSLACRVDLSSQTGGGFGGSPRILAHVRNLNLQPATLGLCQRSRIDMYDGIRDPFIITGKNGLCGQSSGGNYATYNDSFLSLELKTDPQPQIGSFDFTVTSFHVNEVYLDEVCGMSIEIYDMINLKASRSMSFIPALACRVDLSSQTNGRFYDIPRILAHVRNLNIQPATLGLCQRSRIDMYDGIRDPFVITGKNGLCGQGVGYNYATYNTTFLSLELKTDQQPQIGSFDFTITAFHLNARSQGCSSGEWQCSNLRCIDDYLRCNGYNNCGDNSDETDDFCQVLETLAGGAIAAIVIGTLLFAVGFPLLMFYVLCHKKKTSYSSI